MSRPIANPVIPVKKTTGTPLNLFATTGSYGNAGSYGEGAVVDRFNALKALRSQLDSGQMTVQDFLKKAQPLAEETYQQIGSVAGKGSKAANIVNPYVGQLVQLGFKQTPTGQIVPDLGKDYEAQLRQTTLPDNVPDSQKQEIANIPTDIPITSDRGQIEREAIREQEQATGGLNQTTAYRKSALNDLATLLSQQASQNFERSVPQLAEDANTAGIFRSTGYGNSLAEKQRVLQENVANQLGLQGIQDRELTAAGMGDITDARLAAEQAGLARQFSLQDFAQNQSAAQKLADAYTPQPKGKTRGEKWVQGIQAGTSLVGAGGGISSASRGKSGPPNPNAQAKV